MARRSRDWNKDLALDLRDAGFAREFLLAAIVEGVSVQRALGKVIRAIGVREFAAKVQMAGPNVLRAIHPRHNPTQETLNRLLRPFRLRLSLAEIRPGSSRAASEGLRGPASPRERSSPGRDPSCKNVQNFRDTGPLQTSRGAGT
jgi:DNA-binding phage protein